jgi:hypothetical protein
MLYNTENYWVSGLCPSSGILNTGKHTVSENGSVSVLRCEEGDAYSVGSVRKSLPQSLGHPCHITTAPVTEVIETSNSVTYIGLSQFTPDSMLYKKYRLSRSCA